MRSPGILAGGVSDYIEWNSGLSVADSRRVHGEIRIEPMVSSRGVVRRVEAVADLEVEVNDAFDFCPGNLSEGFTAIYTHAAARLEARGLAVAQPFIARFTLRDRRQPTKFYANDADSDGVPESQPWVGATFPLDNCPAVANPDQADDNNAHGAHAGRRLARSPQDDDPLPGRWRGALVDGRRPHLDCLR